MQSTPLQSNGGWVIPTRPVVTDEEGFIINANGTAYDWLFKGNAAMPSGSPTLAQYLSVSQVSGVPTYPNAKPGSLAWDNLGLNLYVFDGTAWVLVSSGGGVPNLAAVLAVGNVTGANDIVINSPQAVNYDSAILIGGEGVGATAISSSIAIGRAATASAINSVAIGQDASNTGFSSTALGRQASSVGTFCTNIGADSTSGVGSAAVAALGSFARAGTNVTNAVVIGHNAFAGNSIDKTVTIGSTTSNTAGQSILIGSDSVNNGQLSVVIGSSSSAATGLGNVVIGSAAAVTGACQRAVVVGYSAAADALSSDSVVIGFSAGTSGPNTTAIGYDSASTVSASTAIGASSRATAANTTAIGFNAVASVLQSIAIGASSAASGASSTCIGYSSAAAVQGVGIGALAVAATDSTAIGFNCSALSQGIAIGSLSLASVEGVAIGYGAACGANSVTIGKDLPYGSALSYDNVIIGELVVPGGAVPVQNVCIGASMESNATESVMIGYNNEDLGLNRRNTLIGPNNRILPDTEQAVGIGWSNVLLGENAITIGTENTVIGAAVNHVGNIVIGDVNLIQTDGTEGGNGDNIILGNNNRMDFCYGSVVIGEGIVCDLNNAFWCDKPSLLFPNLTFASGSFGLEFTTAGQIVATLGGGSSSKSYKEDVLAFSDAERVLDLELVNFKWKDGFCDCKERCTESPCRARSFGFIAEDVATVLPELTWIAPDPREKGALPHPNRVRYEKIGALLVPVVRNLRDRIQEQATQIQDLQAQIEELKIVFTSQSRLVRDTRQKVSELQSKANLE